MNDLLREKMEVLIKMYGMKNTFFARKIGVSRSMICLFRKKKRNLSKRKQILLNDYFQEFGYCFEPIETEGQN